MDEKIKLLHSHLNEDKTVTLHLPDMPVGVIDIVVIQKKEGVPMIHLQKNSQNGILVKFIII